MTHYVKTFFRAFFNYLLLEHNTNIIQHLFSYVCYQNFFSLLAKHFWLGASFFFNLLDRTYTISPSSNGERRVFLFSGLFYIYYTLYTIRYLAADLSFILLKLYFKLNFSEFRDFFSTSSDVTPYLAVG